MAAMDSRWRFGMFVAVIVAACVPTPAGQVTPAPPGGTAPNGASGLPSPADGETSPSRSPSFVRPTPTASPTFAAYLVRAGDSLTSIARLFGTTARSIAYWNRDRYPSLDPDSETYEPNRIEIGWTLLLIPTEVVAEEELPDPTPSPSATPASAEPSASAG